MAPYPMAAGEIFYIFASGGVLIGREARPHLQIRNLWHNAHHTTTEQLSHDNNLEEATCPKYCARVPIFTAIVVYPVLYDPCPWLGQLKF